MEDIIVAYQNITARQYVRNVDRLHRRWKSENQTSKRTLVVLLKVEQLTVNERFEVNHHDHRKTHKCKENGRHAATLEIPGRAYEGCQDKLKKPTVKSDQTIMLTLSIGGRL